MMKRFKTWLMEHFLPAWAKETVLEENRQLRAEVAELREQLAQKEAFIAGFTAGTKALRRITIHTGAEVKK